MTIIERIHLLFKQKHKTATDLAKYIEVEPANISNWKRRGSDPPASLIPQIARFFNVSTDYIITGEPASAFTSTINSENQALIKRFIELDLEGKILVKATIIEELRRLNKLNSPQ